MAVQPIEAVARQHGAERCRHRNASFRIETEHVVGHEPVHFAPRRFAGAKHRLPNVFALCGTSTSVPLAIVGINGLPWAIMVVNGAPATPHRSSKCLD